MQLIGLWYLYIENYKIIKGAQLDFDGQRLVQLRGENGAGKSSIIEAIERLFRGGSAPGVVTAGQKKSTLIGKFGDYTATKIIEADGKATLTLKKEGFGNLQGAQTFLNELAGQFIDPVSFAELPGKEARGKLVAYAGIDFVPIDAKIAQKETARLLKGQDLKKVGQPTPCAKVEPVSVSELLVKRKEIEDFNKEQDETTKAIIEATDLLYTDLFHIFAKAKNSSLSFINGALIQMRDYFNLQSETIKKLPQPEKYESTRNIDNQIATAEETNKKAIAYAEYIRKQKERDTLQEEHDNLTTEIKQLRQERSNMLTKASLPLPGLEITDDTLTLNGIGYDTLSTSERLKIALTLAVKYAGELKVIYIKRGECLDTKSLAKLKEFAEAKDFQIFIEIVDDSYSVEGDGVIYIKEGEMRSR